MDRHPTILGSSAVGGGLEKDGPLGESFDFTDRAGLFGESSWEKAENKMQQLALKQALNKAHLRKEDLNLLFAGDLLNQCTGSSYALREFMVPFLGVYGACSTMSESLLLASVFVDAGLADRAGAVTSSHFCSAERQYRFPLEYGSQRPQTAQWTATAAGAVLVGRRELHPAGRHIEVVHACAGIIEDPGITDANNMGAAMAPAAACLLKRFFIESGTGPQNYDRIFTGDLGQVGSDLLYQLLERSHIRIDDRHDDCGLLLFDRERQDVHAGGSGCGCSASVLAGHILPSMLAGEYRDVILAATGALLSPTMVQQRDTIPGISHLVHLRVVDE
jgi:stage V sporulation protein AD